jgi:uncharacterized integral membrane protein (TIGR00697 family)
MSDDILPIGLLIGLYTGLLVLTNIAATKIIEVGAWTTTAGVVTIAFAFVVSDITVERYGKAAGHSLVWVGVSTLAATTLLGQTIVLLPGSGPADAVLSASLPIFVASLTTLIVSQHLDVWLFSVLRQRGRIAANLGSTPVSQAADTTVFTILAFAIFPVFLGGRTLGSSALVTVIVTEWVIKLGLAIIDTPVFLALSRGGSDD